MPGGERESAGGDEIDAAADFSDHRADGRAAQCFFHHPQHVARFWRGDHQQFFWGKAERVETGAMRCAAFDERNVFGDPQHLLALTRRKREGKAADDGHLGLARRGDLVQGAAGEPTAESTINGGDAERNRTGIVGQCLAGVDRLAQGIDLWSY